ncbi:LacI family transcriptional regulator [Jatrophihabitans sp. GAS493]|uniref:LacI family DNA-binding transcriptional regulator n=1 Tax=Jatrophihabitans sp. GAS493 TaxID=1907575 RepID=UPI000BC06E29|nr:LacI family DNA-binding transcriptional regulator [Jatrophihabitans sp. GAS493]SOD74499.1 LacI family transcriptional regulator [Jatrophihabitans sp. GAS493]
MRTSQQRITLVKLAEDLGVSRATVSNAYNHPDQLSKALRARILQRAEELGFAGPDPAGRQLRGARVGAVGVLVDQGLSYAFSDPTAVRFLDGLAREVQLDGFGLLVHAASDGEDDLRRIRDASVDAWVIQSLPDESLAVAAARARGKPMVVLDQPALDGVPLVSIDDFAGAVLAANHLIELGHRRIAVLTMPLLPDGRQGMADAHRQAAIAYRVMRERLGGVRSAMVAAGLDWDQISVLECASNDPDAGALAAQTLLESHRPPTALLALSDQIALGALRGAQEADVHVPDQLSVIGFDDSPLAQHAYPPLTTVAQPIRTRGQALGSALRALLRGEEVDSPEPYDVSLVVRSSTSTPW